MKGRVTACIVLLLVTAACRPDTVELAYAYPDEGGISYRLEARANATWDIGGSGSGSYEVTFDVTEAVQSREAEGVVVSVSMVPDPDSVIERGLPSPGTDVRSFALRIGIDGQVLEVLEVDGVPAEDLDADELAFIGMYRPPLPPEPVRLGDVWRAQQDVELPGVSQQMATIGELVGLRRDEGGRLAELAYSGEGPLVWTTTLPQGEAELSGSAVSDTAAELDIDAGFLRSASSLTSGEFDVRVDPGGQQAPIVGTLHLDLELSLKRLAP